MQKEKMAVILNASSGNQDLDLIFQQIKSIGRELELEMNFFLVHQGTDIHQITKKALDEQYGVIVAGGGDGTISAVASELIGTSAVMGVLPLGTRNHFSKDIQIPIDLRAAIEVLAHGVVMSVDVASVNDQFFINNSSIGIYPKIVKLRDDLQQKGTHKWFALISAFFLVASRNSFLRLRIVSAEKNVDCRVPLLFVGNNKYTMQGYEFGSRNGLVGGKLFFSAMRRTKRLRLFRKIMWAASGLFLQDEDFDSWESREAIVHSKKKFLEVALDGEIIALQTPLHYRVHPNSLKVIVPSK
jgi:diacylglycerol kinase family enzyme